MMPLATQNGGLGPPCGAHACFQSVRGASALGPERLPSSTAASVLTSCVLREDWLCGGAVFVRARGREAGARSAALKGKGKGRAGAVFVSRAFRRAIMCQRAATCGLRMLVLLGVQATRYPLLALLKITNSNDNNDRPNVCVGCFKTDERGIQAIINANIKGKP